MKTLAKTAQGGTVAELAPEEIAFLERRTQIEAGLAKLDRIVDLANNGAPDHRTPSAKTCKRPQKPARVGKTRSLERAPVSKSGADAARAAAVALLEDGEPRTAAQIHEALCASGFQFTAKNPLHALRQMLGTNKHGAFRKVSKGLYTVATKPPSRAPEKPLTKGDLSRVDRELVDAEPTMLTQEAKERRLELLKQLAAK